MNPIRRRHRGRGQPRPSSSASRCWVGFHSSGTSGIVPLEIALEVAEQVGMPLMAAYRSSAAELRGGARPACVRATSSPTRSGRFPTRRPPPRAR